MFVAKGETIWTVGSEVDFFGLVASGFVKMSRPGPNYQEITTEIMGPGHVFGLLGTLDGTGCPQTARAINDVWYLRIPKSSILPVTESNVVLKDDLLRRTSFRLRASFDVLASLSLGSVPQRVAAILLVLSRSFGHETEEGLALDVPLTRQEIAELAGTTVESTIRVMSEWQKRGWIATHSRHVVIRDLDAVLSARDH